MASERRPRARAPDFSRAVLDDLYTYPRKRKLVAWPLWLVTGVLGGHRFYLNRTGTGILMFLTAGGGLIWWIVDAFLLNGMVEAYNREQAQRERSGFPPIALEFMPAVGEAKQLAGRPDWAARRSGLGRLAGGAVVLTVAGMALGATTVREGTFEALLAVVALIGVTSFGARWDELARLPVLRELDRWSHRLRLYYYSNDPGGPLSLLFRPVVGPVTAVFRKRARAEVRLYLQLGAVFAIVFTLFDVAAAAAVTRSGIEFSLEPLVEDIVVTFISVYAFATPIGATLTTHLLLERTDRVVWGLSGLALAAIGVGLLAA